MSHNNYASTDPNEASFQQLAARGVEYAIHDVLQAFGMIGSSLVALENALYIRLRVDGPESSQDIRNQIANVKNIQNILHNIDFTNTGP